MDGDSGLPSLSSYSIVYLGLYFQNMSPEFSNNAFYLTMQDIQRIDIFTNEGSIYRCVFVEVVSYKGVGEQPLEEVGRTIGCKQWGSSSHTARLCSKVTGCFLITGSCTL